MRDHTIVRLQIVKTSDSTILPMDQLAADDQSRSGAKAYNCARLAQGGFPVPDGLIVLSTASNGEVASLAAHPWFDTQPAGATFAVRSSGIGEDGVGESFAGIHQTLLGVDRMAVTAAVVECRASAFAPQAIEYRRARGMPVDAIAMGVLIQRLIDPVVAGVAFTINPITGAHDEVVINASWGLGEALVSGHVDPDEFIVGKRDGALRYSWIGEKGETAASAASLTPQQIAKLSTLLLAIEEHYGSPQDVEWCHDGERFWIVQSRPVTTMRRAMAEVEWSRANLAEVMPDLTCPQALAAFEDMLGAAQRRYLGNLLAPESELGRVVQTFHGRLYFNLTQMRRICSLGGVAPAAMLKSMGHADALEPSDEAVVRPPLRDLVQHLPDFLKLAWRHLHAADIVRQHQQRIRRQLASFAAIDPRSASDAGLWTVIAQWYGEAADAMQPVLLLSGVLFHEAPVRNACAKVGFPFEQLVYPQLATGQRSVSARQAFELVALADLARHEPRARDFFMNDPLDVSRMRADLRGTAFLAAFDRFLAAYGHRGRYEYDWSLPRYAEDPLPLLQTVRAHLAEPATIDEAVTAVRQVREAERAWRQFEARLTPWQKWTLLPGVRRSIAKIKQYYVWREQVRSDLVRVLAVLRSWHLVLADRFVARGWLDRRDDYFLLLFPEIAAAVRGEREPNTLRAIAAERARERERLRRISMPLLMRASELPALMRHAGVSGGVDAEDETTLRGQAVSGGCVEAEVVVIRDPGDFGRMKRGAILVAPATDPSWTPLFTLASGVIVEVGGVLSHASTIAREYGLPALANVKHATRRLKTGDRVRLDANGGVIERLSQRHDRRSDRLSQSNASQQSDTDKPTMTPIEVSACIVVGGAP